MPPLVHCGREERELQVAVALVVKAEVNDVAELASGDLEDAHGVVEGRILLDGHGDAENQGDDDCQHDV